MGFKVPKNVAVKFTMVGRKIGIDGVVATGTIVGFKVAKLVMVGNEKTNDGFKASEFGVGIISDGVVITGADKIGVGGNTVGSMLEGWTKDGNLNGRMEL